MQPLVKSPHWLTELVNDGTRDICSCTYCTWKPRFVFGGRPLMSPVTVTGPPRAACSNTMVPVTFDSPSGLKITTACEGIT